MQGSRSQIIGWILGSKSGRRNLTWPGGGRQGFCALVPRKKEGCLISLSMSIDTNEQLRAGRKPNPPRLNRFIVFLNLRHSPQSNRAHNEGGRRRISIIRQRACAQKQKAKGTKSKRQSLRKESNVRKHYSTACMRSHCTTHERHWNRTHCPIIAKTICRRLHGAACRTTQCRGPQVKRFLGIAFGGARRPMKNQAATTEI